MALRDIDLKVFPNITVRHVTVIRVRPGDSSCDFAYGIGDKCELLYETNKEGDVFVAVWMGKWRADAFLVTDEVRRAWCAQLHPDQRRCAGGFNPWFESR